MGCRAQTKGAIDIMPITISGRAEGGAVKVVGRFSTVVKRNGWPEAIALAAQRFGADYQAGRSGDSAAQLVVDMVDRRSDAEDFAHFVLWAAFGVSFSEQHRRGFGSTPAISSAVFRCSQTTLSVYQGDYKKHTSYILLKYIEYIRVLRGDTR